MKTLSIEGFDDDINLLINRAKEVLITMEWKFQQMTGSQVRPCLLKAWILLCSRAKSKRNYDREELAEQSIEELTGIIDLSDEEAGNLIMRARAWFEE